MAMQNLSMSGKFSAELLKSEVKQTDTTFSRGKKMKKKVSEVVKANRCAVIS